MLPPEIITAIGSVLFTTADVDDRNDVKDAVKLLTAIAGCDMRRVILKAVFTKRDIPDHELHDVFDDALDMCSREVFRRRINREFCIAAAPVAHVLSCSFEKVLYAMERDEPHTRWISKYTTVGDSYMKQCAIFAFVTRTYPMLKALLEEKKMHFTFDSTYLTVGKFIDDTIAETDWELERYAYYTMSARSYRPDARRTLRLVRHKCIMSPGPFAFASVMEMLATQKYHGIPLGLAELEMWADKTHEKQMDDPIEAFQTLKQYTQDQKVYKLPPYIKRLLSQPVRALINVEMFEQSMRYEKDTYHPMNVYCGEDVNDAHGRPVVSRYMKKYRQNSDMLADFLKLFTHHKSRRPDDDDRAMLRNMAKAVEARKIQSFAFGIPPSDHTVRRDGTLTSRGIEVGSYHIITRSPGWMQLTIMETAIRHADYVPETTEWYPQYREQQHQDARVDSRDSKRVRRDGDKATV